MCEQRIKIPSAMAFSSDGCPAVILVMAEDEALTLVRMLNFTAELSHAFADQNPGMDVKAQERNLRRVQGALLAAVTLR